MLGTSLQKRLRIENLEEKVPLASDVTISVIDGDLVITGDAGDNYFLMEEALFDGHQYRIIGREQTFINGVTNEWIFFDGVTRDVKIDLGDGADKVFAYGFPTFNNSEPLEFPRDLVANMGGGDDYFVLGVTEDEAMFFNFVTQSTVDVARDVTINMGTGTDSVLMSGTAVGDDLSITDPGGDTSVSVWPGLLWQFFPVDMSVGDDFNVILGSGNDLVDIPIISVGGDVTYGLGGGDDYASLAGFTAGGSVLVNAGAGANEVHVESGTVGGGVLMTGSGTNNFQVSLVDVGSSIVMLTGSNSDQFYIINSNAGSAILTAGGGADYVQLTDSAFDLLMVNLGAGGDTLNLDGVTSRLAILLGGGGTDTLQESADNSFLLAIDLSFEVFQAI